MLNSQFKYSSQTQQGSYLGLVMDRIHKVHFFVLVRVRKVPSPATSGPSARGFAAVPHNITIQKNTHTNDKSTIYLADSANAMSRSSSPSSSSFSVKSMFTVSRFLKAVMFRDDCRVCGRVEGTLGFSDSGYD
jgi:hypothetical protein